MRRMRSGVTIIELLVVITILGMLVALLLPAVMRARATGSKTTCTTNLKDREIFHTMVKQRWR